MRPTPATPKEEKDQEADGPKIDPEDLFVASLQMVVGFHHVRGLSEKQMLAMGTAFLIKFHMRKRGRAETEQVFNRIMEAIERGVLS